MVIIMGTSLAGKSPGMVVPSSEQKQSGKTQTAGSQGGARLGSVSASIDKQKEDDDDYYYYGEKLKQLNFRWLNIKKTRCHTAHDFL